MKSFFAADHHFGHKNIIKYANRPFADVDEMDEALIQRHNSQVKPNDVVYFVGDFSFHSPEKTAKILDRLNGKKEFIPGNHDKGMNNELVRSKFVKFHAYNSYPTVRINDAANKNGYQDIVLNHFAMRVWNKSHHGVFHLYGHSHGSLPDDPTSLSFDIGVDNFDYYPVEFTQVKFIMSKKTWEPIDHHGAS